MNFEQMKSFVSIAKTGSFSVSARERYISQPTISNHLKKLEEGRAYGEGDSIS